MPVTMINGGVYNYVVADNVNFEREVLRVNVQDASWDYQPFITSVTITLVSRWNLNTTAVVRPMTSFAYGGGYLWWATKVTYGSSPGGWRIMRTDVNTKESMEYSRFWTEQIRYVGTQENFWPGLGTSSSTFGPNMVVVDETNVLTYVLDGNLYRISLSSPGPGPVQIDAATGDFSVGRLIGVPQKNALIDSSTTTATKYVPGMLLYLRDRLASGVKTGVQEYALVSTATTIAAPFGYPATIPYTTTGNTHITMTGMKDGWFVVQMSNNFPVIRRWDIATASFVPDTVDMRLPCATGYNLTTLPSLVYAASHGTMFTLCKPTDTSLDTWRVNQLKPWWVGRFSYYGYWAREADVSAAGDDAWDHYTTKGIYEGRWLPLDTGAYGKFDIYQYGSRRDVPVTSSVSNYIFYNGLRQGMIDPVQSLVYSVVGNNGGVSCQDYCTGSAWGGTQIPATFPTTSSTYIAPNFTINGVTRLGARSIGLNVPNLSSGYCMCQLSYDYADHFRPPVQDANGNNGAVTCPVYCRGSAWKNVQTGYASWPGSQNLGPTMPYSGAGTCNCRFSIDPQYAWN
jgi:hypothetical protein